MYQSAIFDNKKNVDLADTEVEPSVKSLKKQIVALKKDFDERIKLIQEQRDSIIQHNDAVTNFIHQIGEILGVHDSDDFRLMKLILEKLTNRDNGSNISDVLSPKLEKNDIQQARIRRFKDNYMETDKLVDIMDNDMNQKANDIASLKKRIADQTNELSVLSRSLRNIMNVCGTNNLEEVLNIIKQFKNKVYMYEHQAKDNKFNQILDQIRIEQREKFKALQAQVDSNIKLIQKAFKIIENTTKDSEGFEVLERLYNNIDKTNQKLEERIKEIEEDRSYETVPEVDIKPIMPRRKAVKVPKINLKHGFYDNDIDNTLWMAETKEILALERQVNRMDNYIENSKGKTRAMINEYLYGKDNERTDMNNNPAHFIAYNGTLL